MNKLFSAVVLLSFGTAYAQGADKAKPAAAPAAADKAKPATAPAPGNAPAGAAAGTAGAPSAEMGPPKPGPETEALKPFAHSSTMTGTMNAGAMGNNPEMATKGKETCKWVLNNLWVACDIEETTGSGKTAMKWMGHLVFGYDMMAKGYRATIADNMGTQSMMKGTLDGTKLSWESMSEMKAPPGMPTKERVTLDAADPKAIKFTSEHYVNGKWTVAGTAIQKVAAK